MKSFAQAPANIALIKYWGKRGNQLPANPSLSFTLKQSFTETAIQLVPKTNDQDLDIEFYFENARNQQFEERVVKYFNSVSADFDLLHEHKLIIYSTNSFPHSAGIASSASGIAASSVSVISTYRLISQGGGC